MEIRDVGIVSPGEMGQALARRFGESGLRVHAALDGRTARTRSLAQAAGIHDCGTLASLVATCDLVISVVSPALAPAVAGEVAEALRATGRRISFADFNAISPRTARDEERLIVDAGGAFIDGGVIGPPPTGPNTRTRVYVSGPDAALFEQVRLPNLEIRVLSDRVGDASALKMCYAALTKGITAITVELLVAAHELGVEEAVVRELREARPDVFDWQMRSIAVMPAKADRWVPEMQEIARTFGELGLTPDIFIGAAGLFAMVAEMPIAQETPEEARASTRTGLDVTRSIAAAHGR
jgi:3-hydroxyisobutyrate dehydrogenase-like beta-hydroxyacid dehydrogenase